MNKLILTTLTLIFISINGSLANIIEKELKAFGKLLPADIISNFGSKVSPQIEKIINQSGYIKKSNYKNLEKLINDLEKRINDLENS